MHQARKKLFVKASANLRNSALWSWRATLELEGVQSRVLLRSWRATLELQECGAGFVAYEGSSWCLGG